MTITREDLEECRRAAGLIDDLEGRIETLESRMMRVTVQLSQTGTRGSGLPYDDAMARDVNALQQLRDELRDRLIGYRDSIARVHAAADILPPDQRRVLLLRYADGLDWEAVADRSGYSLPRAFSLHREALEKLIVNDS